MSYQDALIYQATHLDRTVIEVAEWYGAPWLVLYAIYR